MKTYSQFKEDLYLWEIFKTIEPVKKVCVEFGGADGYRCSNTRLFIENGWKGHLWDKNPGSKEVKEVCINADNVNEIFTRKKVQKRFDLLSIDIDSNDYWVWKELNHTPSVVIIEFNPSIPKDKALTVAYDPNFEFQKTNYFGASWKALKLLGESKGYRLVNVMGCNMIFVLEEYDYPVTNTEYKCASGWPLDKTGRPWIDLELN